MFGKNCSNAFYKVPSGVISQLQAEPKISITAQPFTQHRSISKTSLATTRRAIIKGAHTQNSSHSDWLMTLFGFWSLLPQSIRTLRGNYVTGKAALALAKLSWVDRAPPPTLPLTSSEIHSQTAGHASVELEFNYTFDLSASTPISPQACYFAADWSSDGKTEKVRLRVCTKATARGGKLALLRHVRGRSNICRQRAEVVE